MRFNKYSGILILLITGIFPVQSSFCQKNYLPGNLIELSGKRISGYIDYRNPVNSPDEIRFKETLDGAPRIYKPIDINGYSIQGKFYTSAIVETEVSPTKTTELQFSPGLKIIVDTVFLQAIIIGSKSLYYYKDGQGKDHLYIKQESSFNLLIYKRYYKVNAGKNRIVENKKYIGQLALYLSGCPSIQSKLGKTWYSLKSLENLFIYYSECTQSEIVFLRETEKISTEFGILTGGSVTSVDFSGKYHDYLVDVDYPQSVNFSAGLFLDVIFPRRQKKWSIYNELFFTSWQVNGGILYVQNANQSTYFYTELGYSYLKINNMIRFKYPIRGFFFYLNAGMSNGYVINERNYQRRDRISFTSEWTVEEKALNETRKYEQGYIVGLGSRWKKFSFEMRYERGNGISEYVTLNSATDRFYFLLGFQI